MDVGKIDDSTLRYQQTKAREAERENQKKIEDARKQVEAARTEADHELEILRDDFSKQYMTQEQRNSEQLEQQRIKAYEQMLTQKRQQEAEIARTKRIANKELSDIKSGAEIEVNTLESDTKKKTNELSRTLARNQETQNQLAANQFELERSTQTMRLGLAKEEHDQTLDKLAQQHRSELEHTKEAYVNSNQEALQKYDTTYKKNLETQSESINRENTLASKQLNDLRADHTEKLDAYNARAGDPFYRMLETNSRIVDRDQFYQLTAKIPEHERENVNVTVRGNQVVLSGTRRNADSLEIAPGQTRKTNAFQSFTETFPISWPVDARGITQYYDGDTLVVTIPKKPVEGYELYKAKRPERIAAARPDFPANLPVTADQLKKLTNKEKT